MKIILLPQHNIIYTIQLANALSNTQGVTLLLWKNLFDNECLCTINSRVHIEFLNKPRNKNPKNILLIYKTIKIIRSLKPDLVHIQNPFSWMCIGLPFLKKYPIVLTVHDPKPHPGSNKVHSKLTYGMTLHYARKIITHGEKLKETLINEFHLHKDKVHSIPHGDFSFYNEINNELFTEDKNTILFFGRMEKYKGLEYLIKAEPLISKEVPTMKIIIAGAGPELDKYKTSIQNNTNFIIYDQFIPSAKVSELFQKASIVVLPYIEGSQSGIIPIAYAFRKPVVATNVGSIPEVVEDGQTGYIVPPCNAEKLADAIVSLLIDENKRKIMGENAYKKMQKELSWNTIAERTIKIYDEII